MKKYHYTLILSILLISVSMVSDAQFIVRTVYFQPTDAPNPTRQIFEFLTKSQDFYRTEMQRHGYGPKTFKLETDGAGNPGIHHIRGKHNTAHYRTDTYSRVNSELPFHFNRAADAQDNALVIIVAGIDLLSTGKRGFGGYFTGNKAGGVAIIAGEALIFELLAHEIGHTFGLQHTTHPNAIMNAGSDILLDYETRWLDRHHFFNDTHIRNSLPRFVKSLPIETIENNNVQFKIVAESQNGLYQAQLSRKRGGFVVGTAEIEGKSATIKVDMRRAELINGDDVDIQIMDIHGNKTLQTLHNITLPDPIPEPEVEIKVPEEPEFEVEAPEVIVEEKIVEPEVITVDCPDCNPPDASDERAVNPRFLLTIQWAIFKQR